MDNTTQIRAHYGRMYGLVIIMLAAVAVTGSVWAGKSQDPMMDVSAMMTIIDIGSMPVHSTSDDF